MTLRHSYHATPKHLRLQFEFFTHSLFSRATGTGIVRKCETLGRGAQSIRSGQKRAFLPALFATGSHFNYRRSSTLSPAKRWEQAIGLCALLSSAAEEKTGTRRELTRSTGGSRTYFSNLLSTREHEGRGAQVSARSPKKALQIDWSGRLHFSGQLQWSLS